MRYLSRVATPTLTVGRTYHDLDVVGGLLTFDFGLNKADGYIARILVADNNENKRMPFMLHFFDDQPSNINNHDEYLPTARDISKLICDAMIQSADYKDAGHRSYVSCGNYQLDFALAAKEIYVYIVCMGGTPTYQTDSDLSLKLGVYINE